MNLSPLRRDLHVLPLVGDRDCVVVDDIGGRFARIKRAVWDALRDGVTTAASEPTDAALWQQAVTAGWTQQRTPAAKRVNFSLLSIRIPIASIDPVARRLVRLSDFVYTPRALLCWLTAAIVGVILLIIRWEQWSGAIPSLSTYLQSLDPLSTAMIFVVTKSVHELGHATACRRLGSRPGIAGVWFLCFMPCPYVDVTEVWRQPSPLRRAAVMAAGMVAEGVLCVLAIWVWLISESTSVQLAAMNVILICGVSTILFNANPLMRYDGYFILSDLVDSTNLREEARRAWRQFLIEPVRRWLQLGARAWALLLYHAAAAIYRVSLVIAIAAMLLGLADRWGAWRLVATLFMALAGVALVNKIKAGWSMWCGSGSWSAVRTVRRRLLVVISLLLFVAVLCVPLPRYRHVDGILQAVDVHTLYLPAAGTIDEVTVRVGDHVLQDQPLARISDPELAIEIAATRGRSRVLEHRSRAARLASLQSPRHNSRQTYRSATDAPESEWDVLDAATRAVAITQAELLTRQQKLLVVSPADGIVLLPRDHSGNERREQRDPLLLVPAVDEPSHDRTAWCRVAITNRMQLSLRMPATDHRDVQTGCPVRFTFPGYDTQLYRTSVNAVSPLVARGSSDTVDSDSHFYQAVCEVPAEIQITLDNLARWEGATCQVVVHLPPRAIWQDVLNITSDVIGM
jgi:putative peptide zinc metalloprotease protein